MAVRTDPAPRRRRLLDRLLPARRQDDERPRLSPGWRVIAGKELTDHVTSVRFIVLLVIIGIAAAVPLYFAAGRIRELASQLTSNQAVFLALFTLGPEDFGLLRADTFVGLFAPLLGIAFGFDAVNVERSEGTLPRLVSQPIHRDDVINGKFVAGLSVIALVLVAMVLLVSGFGILQLGLVPDVSEVLRIVAWILVTVLYAGFWLAFGMLLSVLVRRAATSALIGFGAWLLLTFFGGLITSLIGNFVAPISGSNDEILRNVGLQQTISRLLPDTLYREASLVLLNPQVTNVSTPATVGAYQQAQERIPSLLSLDQSFILVWPQVVALVALTVACFAIAYVRFMRQEVRA